ncbi:lipoyl(octanoyl) transferase [Allomyces macrogynus ATCC 38327]|uniref:lipoyl(octanoyl) transferase n=1 Tax=Allomyces macrogynus (strain ATCC 38327) TaxID=578462 RepID=A0A0L0SYS9_ALLM3|nr:lipoyl(octanoyl) transferase [Allomyces macrogynus ATCC 38327]|eukprot:KNE67667.1 lipoyl(octanoyl) transferase [Allomyces macrogynus ATCC 38327]
MIRPLGASVPTIARAHYGRAVRSATCSICLRSLSSTAAPSSSSSTSTCSGTAPRQLLAGHTLAYKRLPGHVPYQVGLALQHATVDAKLRGEAPNVVYLLEHAPVYTAGRRIKGTDATEGARLRRETGAEYYEIQRGGQTTYHGPGQLVGYPILALKELQLGVRCYVNSLETALIRLCRTQHNLAAGTNEHTGVWVGTNKVAALGVHVSRSITQHGFALNVDPDLRYYDHIVPCGITDMGVTSLAKETGKPVTVDEVVPNLLASFASVWGNQWTRLEEMDPEWNARVEEMSAVKESA